MSSARKIFILYLGSDQELLSALNNQASSIHYRWEMVTSVGEIQQSLAEGTPDIVLVTEELRDETLYELIQSTEGVPFVILAEEGEEVAAVKAFKAGVADYLIIDPEQDDLSQLHRTILEAVKEQALEDERTSARKELEKIVSHRTEVLLETNQRLTQETQYRMDLLDELRETEIRYAAILNSTTDVMFIHDLEGHLLDINDKACESLGFTRGELLEMNMGDISNDGESVFTPRRMDEVNKAGQVLFESGLRRKDGSTFPVEITSRLMDFRGKKAVVTIAEDISPRLKSQRDLQEREDIYRRFFRTSQDAVFITTQDGRWVDMNQQAVELFGFESKEDLMKVNVKELYANQGDRQKHIQKVNQEGFTRDYQQKLRRKDGSEFPALISSTVYMKGGEVLGYQGTIRDLSQDRKLAQERDKIAREQRVMDELSQALRSIISLDEMYESMRTHLQKLIGFDYLLLTRVREEDHFLELKYAWGKEKRLEHESLSEISGESPPPPSPIGEVLARESGVSLPHLLELMEEHDVHYAFGSHGEIYHGTEAAGVKDVTRSALIAPLLVEEQEVGMIELQSFQTGAYDDRDLALLTRAANLIAMGVQKSYLLEESKKHIERLQTLRRIDRVITENQSLPMILDTLRDEYVRLLEVDAIDILYLHPELESLKIITQTGFKTNPLQYTDLALGQGPAGHVASTKSRVVIPDLKVAGTKFSRSPDFSQEGFVSYVGVPLLARDELVGVLEVFHRSKLDIHPDWVDFLEGLAGQAAIAIAQRNLYKSLHRSKEQLHEAYDGVIESWAQAMELREIETKGHGERLVSLTLDIARVLGVDQESMDDIRRGAFLHDVGKMGIPDKVLKKKEKLSQKERELIGQHPLYAYEILKSIEYLRPALDIPLYHHERWDGLGYPEGLKGEEIPLAARIFAVVDVWDALRSGRPYRAAWSDEKALDHIKKESGTHFDPQVVDAFLQVVEVEGE